MVLKIDMASCVLVAHHPVKFHRNPTEKFVFKEGFGPQLSLPQKTLICSKISRTPFVIVNHWLVEFQQNDEQAFIFPNSGICVTPSFFFLEPVRSENYTAPVFHSTNQPIEARRNWVETRPKLETYGYYVSLVPLRWWSNLRFQCVLFGQAVQSIESRQSLGSHGRA